jgi:hypothetical protein
MSDLDSLAWYRQQAQEMADKFGEPVLIVPEGVPSPVTGYPSPSIFLTLLSQAEKGYTQLSERIEPQRIKEK